jgi:hypothetical protein
MEHLPEHPEVNTDLAGAPRPGGPNWEADGRMSAFLNQIEKLSTKADYRSLWPDRILESTIHSTPGTISPITIYAWEPEGYVVCLEERFDLQLRPRFRWVACQYNASASSTVADAERRARTPW